MPGKNYKKQQQLDEGSTATSHAKLIYYRFIHMKKNYVILKTNVILQFIPQRDYDSLICR